MSELTTNLQAMISEAGLAQIDAWIAKYPQEERQSAVMAALHIVQDEKGYLSDEVMDAVADYLQMPKVAVYEVASFYTMYQRKPIGRHTVNVCTNISCMLRGSQEVVTALESCLGVSMGETTADNQFTLNKVECLGACVHAPVVQIDKTYHELVEPENVATLLDEYRGQ